MFQKLVFIVLLLIVNHNDSYAQDCTCSNGFNTLQEKVTKNYAGYFDKVNTKSMAQYKAATLQLEKKAALLGVGKECEELLRSYLGFFKDLHLKLEKKYTSEKIIAQYRALPADDLSAYFQQLNLAEDDIRGIWKNDTYELAIVNADKIDYFDAIVITSKNEAWKKGMVKMRLKKAGADYYQIDYITGDFELLETKALFKKNILDILLLGVFEKLQPKCAAPIDIKSYWSISPESDIQFTFPNDSTAILFLGSFGNQYEALVDSLMMAHKQDLEQRPYWIIDVSYNGGGGVGTYKSLLPYLYTNSIKRSGSYYRLAGENVKKFEQFLNETKNLPPHVNTSFSKMVVAGKKRPDSWYFEPGETFRFATIQPNPRQIAVLVSEQTASSGEIFVMDAKQSKKVTVFGTQTRGMVDYGDGFTYVIGCDSLVATIPSRRSEYLKYTSYENIGLSPNVKLPKGDFKPYSSIMDYYARKKQPSLGGRQSKK